MPKVRRCQVRWTAVAKFWRGRASRWAATMTTYRRPPGRSGAKRGVRDRHGSPKTMEACGRRSEQGGLITSCWGVAQRFGARRIHKRNVWRWISITMGVGPRPLARLSLALDHWYRAVVHAGGQRCVVFGAGPLASWSSGASAGVLRAGRDRGESPTGQTRRSTGVG